MAEWEKTTIEECTDVLGDGLHGTPIYDSNGDYAFINGNNLNNGRIIIKPDTKRVSESEYLKYAKPLSDRTVLVSINGTLGNVGTYSGEKVILGKSACYFNVKHSINRDYIYYVVSLPDFRSYMESVATGTTIKNVSLKQMREYEFLIPNKTVQDKIAIILKNIDNKIKLNNQINENLTQQAYALYKSIISNSTSSAQLSDYITIKHGFAFKGEFITTESNSVVLVTPGNFRIGGGFQENKCKYFTAAYSDEYVLRPNDLIVTMTDLSKDADTLGYSALVPDNPDRTYLHNQRIGLVQFRDDRLNKDYVYWFLRSYDYHMQIVGSASGSTVKHTSPGRILEQMIPIPDANDIGKILLMEIIDKTIAKNDLESNKLASIRDGLLPRLMSGELDVSEIDL